MYDFAIFSYIIYMETNNSKINQAAMLLKLFLLIKYDIDEPTDKLAEHIKQIGDGFVFNCHDITEKLGVKLDDFKKEFSKLFTIYSYYTKGDK